MKEINMQYRCAVIAIVLINIISIVYSQSSICVRQDGLKYEGGYDNNDAQRLCKEYCQTKNTQYYGLRRNAGGGGGRSGCFCGDEVPDVCPGPCTYRCGGTVCGGSCDECSSEYCVSFYTVDAFTSGYPKCAPSTNSWSSIGDIAQAIVIDECQERCRMGTDKGTFIAIRRYGINAINAGCFCGDDRPDPSVGGCSYKCGGEQCGGGTGVDPRYSVYPACLEGTYGQQCEHSCLGSCLEYVCDVKDGSCPYGCIQGSHGNSCTQTCPYCINGCIQDTGVCNPGGCQVGFYGDSCDKNCSRTCLDDKCAQPTGKCEGCITGRYGDNCTQTCPNCISGCIQDTGVCTAGGCRVGFHGESCDKNCSRTCLDDKCAQATGKCDGCVTGHYGDNCMQTCPNCISGCIQDTGVCEAGGCRVGFHGESCDKNCSTTCFDYKCAQATGKCEGCIKGYYGDECEETCLNCLNDCVQDGGICNGPCKDGYFSQTCEMNCSSECFEGKCDQITAKCDSCEKEYFGDNCTQECSRCFDGCIQMDGVCIGGCKTGWYTPTCNTSCPQNCDGKCDLDVGNCTEGCSNGAFFGSWCSNNCSNSCNERKCDRESGICLACVPGFYNQTCTATCPINCKDRDCHRNNATCVNGCQGDWTGDRCTEKVSGPRLGPGAIAGICVAIIIVVVGIIIGVIFILRKRRIKQNKAKSMTNSAGHVNMAMTMPEEFSDDIFKRDNIEPKTVEDQMITNNTDTNARIYENPNDGKLTAEEFLKYIRVKKHTKDYFKDEYATLPKDTLYDWESANRKFGVKKNRYRDIYPYDYNRVVMEILNNDPLTDYINASRIQGYYDHDKFIASAGPQVWTVDDFWRMVWQEKVTTVVMLTNLKESLAEKCVQYWPKDTPNVTYDDITVSISSEEAFPTYAVRNLRIQKGDHKRQVCQLHFTVWPDHGVPQDPTALLNFRRKVVKKMIKNVPMVIHCSAGVGRTGTFIAMDYLIKQMAAEGAVNVFECVSNLRHQRKHFVQTDEQYKFIHEALAQHISLGDTTIAKSNRQMLENVLRMTDHKMQEEYKILQELALTMKPYDKENALSEENRGKNRDENIIPSLSSCMFLTSRVPGRNAYINAVQVHSFLRKGTFLVTQLPLAETIVDFWRLITDCNSNCIVILYTKEQAKTVPYFLPAKNKPMNVLEEMASVRSSQTNEFFRTVDISVNGQPIQENEYMNMEEVDHGTNGKRLRVFEIMLTPAQETLDPKVVLDVFSGIQQWRKEAGEQPITVTCLNGATYSGQFVASCNLFEMINTDHEVDVFQVAKYVRDSRPQFINSLNQYKGLYETANMVMAQFSIYSNI